MKYTLYLRNRCVLKPVHATAIRSYLASYAGDLALYTVYSAEDTDLAEGMPAAEWLIDNADVPFVPPAPTAPAELHLPSSCSAWVRGWQEGYLAAITAKNS
jgi:hypothetical protein